MSQNTEKLHLNIKLEYDHKQISPNHLGSGVEYQIIHPPHFEF